MIKEFQGEYRWLSNFWPVPVEYEGVVYPSVEHAFQAAKFDDPIVRKAIAVGVTAGQAKRLAKRQVGIRVDWEQAKTSIMLKLIRKKFLSPEFKVKLLATDDQHLQEGNRWGDTFWGVDLITGKGKNWLGVIIMRVRNELREAT